MRFKSSLAAVVLALLCGSSARNVSALAGTSDEPTKDLQIRAEEWVREEIPGGAKTQVLLVAKQLAPYTDPDAWFRYKVYEKTAKKFGFHDGIYSVNPGEGIFVIEELFMRAPIGGNLRDTYKIYEIDGTTLMFDSFTAAGGTRLRIVGADCIVNPQSVEACNKAMALFPRYNRMKTIRRHDFYPGQKGWNELIDGNPLALMMLKMSDKGGSAVRFFSVMWLIDRERYDLYAVLAVGD